MLEEALVQVQKRLPSSRNVFRDLSKFSLEIILNQLTRPLFSELPFMHLAEGNLQAIEEQYRKLPFVDWKEEFEDGIPNDTEKFWQGVKQHPHFKELSSFVFDCLITPVSKCYSRKSIFSLNLR